MFITIGRSKTIFNIMSLEILIRFISLLNNEIKQFSSRHSRTRTHTYTHARTQPRQRDVIQQYLQRLIKYFRLNVIQRPFGGRRPRTSLVLPTISLRINCVQRKQNSQNNLLWTKKYVLMCSLIIPKTGFDCSEWFLKRVGSENSINCK